MSDVHDDDTKEARVQRWREEWPTLVVVAAVHAAAVAVVVSYERLPVALWVIVAGLVGTWHSSVQHELMHGHPTPWVAVNGAIARIPLTLWVSYDRYRETHIEHHGVELTVPGVDPESRFVSAASWERAGPARRAVLWANQTLLGRMLIGPALTAVGCWRSEWRLARRRADVRRPWLLHLAWCIPVVWAVVVVASVPPAAYLAACYVSISGTLLRSFAEHRPVDGASRSAEVDAAWPWRLLFLNNTLHHTHHALPGAPWHRLGALSRQIDGAGAAAAGAGWYRGYAAVARAYLFRPIAHPVHPSGVRLDR